MVSDSGRPGRLALGVLFATILLDFVGFSILIPVLPIHLEGLGADAVDIGLVLALYVIAMVIFLPFWGWISDRVGRRPVLLICLLGTSASVAMMTFDSELWVFYVARALSGFFGASVGTAQAYVIDITPAEERTRGLGLVSAAGAMGLVFGPALGGLLAEWGRLAPFYGPAVLAFAAFLGAALFLPESRSAVSPPPIRVLDLIRSLVPTPILIFFKVHDNRTRAYLYIFFHVFAAFAVLEGMFPLFAKSRFGWLQWETGLYLSFVAVVTVATQAVLIGWLARLAGDGPLVVIGLGAAAVGMAGISLAPSVPLLYVAGFFVAGGMGVVLPTFTSLFSKNCGTAEEAGGYLAHSQAMVQTGRGLGVIWGGLAFKYLTLGAPFLLGAAGLVGALVLVAIGLPRYLKRRLP